MASLPCDPADPRRNKDLAEIFGPPDFAFTADDAKGPIGGVDDDDVLFELWQEAQHRPPAVDKGGPLAILGRYLRVPEGYLQDLQVQSGIPFYTWYRNIELGRESAEKFLAEPSYSIVPKIFQGFSKKEREQVQQLIEADQTALYEGLAKQAPPKVVAAKDQLMEVYIDYFAKAGLSPDDVGDLLSDVVPGLRKKDGDFKAWSAGGRTVPKIGRMLERAIRTGEINVDREMDAGIIARQMFRGVAMEKWMAPHWNLVMTQFKAFGDEMTGVQPMSTIFLKYLHEVRHAPDVMQVGIARSMQRVVERIDANPMFRKVLGTHRLSNTDSRDLVSALVGMNYQANMAFNPGAILRQYMQTLQTTAPHLGINDTLKGIKQAVKWYRDESLQKFYEQRGIVTRDVMHERFREVEEVMSQFKPGGLTGKAKEALDFMRTKGTYAFKKGDDFNRIVAYHGMQEHARPWAQRFVEGQIDWETFVERSKLDTQGPRMGPFEDVVKARLTAGDVEGAVHEMSRKFVRDTQFVYSRGNNPFIMQSTVGRFLGQYGTWPVWFAEYMRNMFTRGSYRNRATAFGRWMGINSAMMYGTASVFGVDMSRWTFFAPVAYSGGPFLEMGQQATSAANVHLAGSTDPLDQIQAARLKQNLITQTVPIPWAASRHVASALDRLWNQDYDEAMREFLGLPKVKK